MFTRPTELPLRQRLHQPSGSPFANAETKSGRYIGYSTINRFARLDITCTTMVRVVVAVLRAAGTLQTRYRCAALGCRSVCVCVCVGVYVWAWLYVCMWVCGCVCVCGGVGAALGPRTLTV